MTNVERGKQGFQRVEKSEPDRIILEAAESPDRGELLRARDESAAEASAALKRVYEFDKAVVLIDLRERLGDKGTVSFRIFKDSEEDGDVTAYRAKHDGQLCDEARPILDRFPYDSKVAAWRQYRTGVDEDTDITIDLATGEWASDE